MDSYITIDNIAEGLYKEKGSKFLAFAYHVRTTDEIKEILDTLRKEHHDARHVCYAYMLGPEKKDFRAADDSEPSGTAGRPILGAILSSGATDILIAVVRYFGGTKLGTSGLINAYKTASQDAMEHAVLVEKTVDAEITFSFEYVMMNDVMKVIKDLNPNVISQSFDNDCVMTLSIRKGEFDRLKDRLLKIDRLRVDE